MASPANKINSDPFPEDCAVLIRYPLPAATTKERAGGTAWWGRCHKCRG